MTIWVDSGGGPLVVVPETALAGWRGVNPDDGDGDDDDDAARACAVEGLAGAVAVGHGGAQALVLGDEPARTCYLPEIRAFVRWHAAHSAESLIEAARALVADPAVAWDDCGTWQTDGPAVLMDAGEDGAGPWPAGRAKVAIGPGRWRVGAAWIEGPHTWGTVVRLLPDAT
jgi:hypothetical protein